MTVDELKAKLPPEFQPWAADYGAALIAMGVDGIKEWIDLLIRGDVFAAYGQLVAAMDTPGILDEWTKLTAEWQAANVKNADRLELQRAAVVAALKIALAMALGVVGL